MKSILILALLAPLTILAEEKKNDLKQGDLIYFHDPDAGRMTGGPVGWAMDRMLNSFHGPTSGRLVSVEPVPHDTDGRVKVIYETYDRREGKVVRYEQKGALKNFKKLRTEGDFEMYTAYEKGRNYKGRIQAGSEIEFLRKPESRFRVIGFTHNAYVCVQSLDAQGLEKDRVTDCMPRDNFRIPVEPKAAALAKAKMEDKAREEQPAEAEMLQFKERERAPVVQEELQSAILE